MKRKKVVLIILVLIVLGAATVIKNKDIFIHSSERVSSGTIEADRVIIRAEVGGTVEKIFVREGEPVQKEASLMKIDDTVLKLQVAQAEAQLESLRQKLEDMKNGTRSQDLAKSAAVIEQIRSREEKAKIGLEMAEKNYARAKEIFQEGGISQQEFESSEALYLQAKNDLADLKAQLDQAHAGYDLLQEGPTAGSIASMEASVKDAAARLEIQKVMLAKSNVTAPAAGMLASLMVEEGELVAPQSSLVNLEDLSHLWVNIYIPEKDLGLISTGEEVKVTLDAFPGETFPGIVSRIADRAEYTPLNTETEESEADLVFAVRVKIPGDTGKLRPGMTADVYYH